MTPHRRGLLKTLWNQHFLHFQQCFLFYHRQIQIFTYDLICHLQNNGFNLGESEFCLLVKSFRPLLTEKSEGQTQSIEAFQMNVISMGSQSHSMNRNCNITGLFCFIIYIHVLLKLTLGTLFFFHL